MLPERKFHSRTLYPEMEVFPREEIEKIKQMGEQLVSPFWVFSRFGLTYAKDKRDLVIAKISQTTHGNEINFLETERGLRICANNVEPLLRAVGEIYLSSLELLPEKTRRAIDKLFVPVKS